MMYCKKRNTMGFTLIELLIVVAIIAILAAIAVPNFLQAQTRAKVSRSMADMRSNANAIEEYTVDYNRPPIGWQEAKKAQYDRFAPFPSFTNEIDEFNYAMSLWAQLTTPTAYISSVPRMTFPKPGAAGSGKRFWSGQPYEYNSICDYPGRNPAAKDKYNTAMKRGYVWAQHCNGPNPNTGGGGLMGKIGAATYVQALDRIYDPTNGTSSLGLIGMTNKGFYKGPDW